MTIAIRSYLMAGMAAAVGASAIALTPVAPAGVTAVSLPDLATAQADVQLAAFANPITAAIDTLGLAASWLGDPTPLASFPADYPIYTYGLLPNIVIGNPKLGLGGGIGPFGSSFPVIRQFINNQIDYARDGANFELAALRGVINGTLSLPGGLVSAGALAIGGKFPEALAALEATWAPFDQAIQNAINGVLYPVLAIAQRGTAALGATWDLVVATVQSIVTNGGLIFGAVQNTFNEIVTAGSFEGVWNAAVGGLIGQTLPSGKPSIPAQTIRSTIGAQANFPFDAPIINSVRADVTNGIQNISRALDKDVVIPGGAAAVSAPAPAAAASAPAEVSLPVAEVSAPVAEASAPVITDKVADAVTVKAPKVSPQRSAAVADAQAAGADTASASKSHRSGRHGGSAR